MTLHIWKDPKLGN
jgi:hypothetical protein